MPFACLALLIAVALPAWRAPASLVMTGGAPQRAEARALTLLAQASEHLLSPLADVPAQPGFPAETVTPADAPGLLAGVLALPVEAAGEPVLAWNLTTLLLSWLAALAMLVLVNLATRSATAAFFAAIAWALPPDSLEAPLALLIRVTPLLPAAALASARLVGMPRPPELVAAGAVTILIATAPPAIALAAACVAGLSALLARSYQARRRLILATGLGALVWLLLGHGRGFPPAELPFFYGALSLGSFFPGATAFPGGVLMLLALVGALYRGGGNTAHLPVRDPRTLLTALVVLIPLAFSDSLELPGGTTIRLPLAWLRTASPDAAATLAGLRLLLPFALVLLAGYGTAALTRLLPAGALRNTMLAVLVGLLLLENLHPLLSQASFGRTANRDAFRLIPPPAEAALLHRTQPGALVDLPAGVYDPGAHRLRAAAWHRRATPESPARPSVASAALEGMVAAPTENARAEALAALGVGNLLLHKHDFDQDEFASLLRGLARTGGAGGRLYTLAESPAHLLLGLKGQSTTSESLDALESNLPAETRLPLRGRQDLIVFEIRAHGKQNFRNPEPDGTTELTIRFFDAQSRLVSTEKTRALLPLAIGRGGRAYTALQAKLPETPGHHTATLAPSHDPTLTLAIQPVSIEPIE